MTDLTFLFFFKLHIYLFFALLLLLFFCSLHLLGKFIPVVWVFNSILIFSVIVKFVLYLNLLLCCEINKVNESK